MNNITIDEVKDILKCSIDETTNMNEAIERTLQHIYLKGWNDSEKEHNYYLKKMRAEIAEYGSIWVAYAITDKTKTDKGIERLVSDVLSQAKKQVLDIIDKYKAEREE